MTTYFTSDLHLGHANIIKYCNRPFTSAEEMDEAIIRNYNERVSPEDTCYFIGDIIFAKGFKDRRDTPENLLRRLHGRKHLIFGNHDRVASLGRYFVSCQPYSEIEINYDVLGDGRDSGREGPSDVYSSGSGPKVLRESSQGAFKQLIILCHYPFLTWNKSHYGSWNLHGHCHGTLPDDNNALRLDVGVDVHNFRPISFNEIAEIMAKKEFKSIDHHGKTN